jgi:diacylglycerol kinase (ATP)
MPLGSTSWLIRRLAAFKDAGHGIHYLVKNEPPIWVHLTDGVLTVSLAIFFHVTLIEWAIIALTLGACWTAEAFNTAIEKLCDALHPDHNPQIGRVKDICAGAVLIIVIANLVVTGIIFFPKLYAML